ncbi:MAG: hypothetical protein ACYDA3_07885 [Gaiellaceae bacterium]
MWLQRYGTKVVFLVLAVLAVIFAIAGSWVFAVILALAAFGSWFVGGVKRSTGR